MPRKLNPGTLRTGHGKAAPDENVIRPSLTGTGLVGVGPNIGILDGLVYAWYTRMML